MAPQPTVTILSIAPDREMWIPCAGCGRSTSHRVLTGVRWEDDEEDGYWERADYLTVVCQGCKAVSFCREADSAAHEEGADRTIFPGRVEGRRALPHHYLLPFRVRDIYNETHVALANEQPILAGIGIRAIVEAVCAEKSAVGNDLKHRIDDLATKGHVTRAGADILHSLRFMGNDAAHETKAHTAAELSTAMDVVEYLLNGVYILPYQAARRLAKKTP
jgi:hypothetical protein